jgi:hypothetical protein
MVPPMTAMPHDNAEFDTEFDLDVRLQAVTRNVSAEKPGPEGTVVSCLNSEHVCNPNC